MCAQSAAIHEVGSSVLGADSSRMFPVAPGPGVFR